MDRAARDAVARRRRLATRAPTPPPPTPSTLRRRARDAAERLGGQRTPTRALTTDTGRKAAETAANDARPRPVRGEGGAKTVSAERVGEGTRRASHRERVAKGLQRNLARRRTRRGRDGGLGPDVLARASLRAVFRATDDPDDGEVVLRPISSSTGASTAACRRRHRCAALLQGVVAVVLVYGLIAGSDGCRATPRATIPSTTSRRYALVPGSTKTRLEDSPCARARMAIGLSFPLCDRPAVFPAMPRAEAHDHGPTPDRWTASWDFDEA